MPRARKPPQPKPQQLLVEGKNDQHVIWALCEQHQLPETFSVEVPQEEDGQGVDILLAGLPDRLRQENLRTLGIVVDADQDLQSRWDAVRDRLMTTGYPKPPKSPSDSGFICASPDPFLPRVGVWLMPDNQLPGMLEDFVAHLIPQEDLLKSKANSVLQELEQDQLLRCKTVHRPKALIHTWLAWQETPGMPMGQAITAQALKYDSPIAITFVEWLKSLFECPPNPFD